MRTGLGGECTATERGHNKYQAAGSTEKAKGREESYPLYLFTSRTQHSTYRFAGCVTWVLKHGSYFFGLLGRCLDQIVGMSKEKEGELRIYTYILCTYIMHRR